MRTIVVPVNFSPNSINAAYYAADMARTIGAEINLISVMQSPAATSGLPMPGYAFEEMRDSNYDLLTSLSAELLKRTNNQVEVSVALEIGGVQNKLETFCGNKRTFLVVMGASAGSPQNNLQETNAVSTIRHLPYPVLIIPANTSFHAVKKILLACDQEDIDSGMPVAVPFLKEISELMGAVLEVVHVLVNEKETEREGVAAYDFWKKNVTGLATEMHFIRQPMIEEGIYHYSETSAADWLMIFPKHHALLEFHKSRTKQIIMHCPLPLLSLHE
jgi:nucleotide-binding universal stress UspA family protein